MDNITLSHSTSKAMCTACQGLWYHLHGTEANHSNSSIHQESIGKTENTQPQLQVCNNNTSTGIVCKSNTLNLRNDKVKGHQSKNLQKTQWGSYCFGVFLLSISDHWTLVQAPYVPPKPCYQVHTYIIYMYIRVYFRGGQGVLSPPLGIDLPPLSNWLSLYLIWGCPPLDLDLPPLEFWH